MIYRGMDIGTAKPSAEELARAPHRLIDICDPAEIYSAADFRDDALALMDDITRRDRIPLLVGGTMMYYRALLSGLSDLPPADPGIRRALEQEAAEQGWPALHARLRAQDPIAAEGIHPNNRQRLTRALEVIQLTGRPISEAWASSSGGVDSTYSTQWQADGGDALPYNPLQLAIAPASRSVLHERISERFKRMLELGFVDEVRALYQRPDLHSGLPSVRCVGYRQVWSWLAGQVDYTTCVGQGQAATRQLAKRQLTWLRKWRDLHWLDAQATDPTTDALKILGSRTIFTE